MKGIGIGPTGGRALSRMQGTEVTLAGRTAFPTSGGGLIVYVHTSGVIQLFPYSIR